jgi:hypothetical protein
MDTFVGDTPRLVIKTGIDLSGYDTLLIKFRRPNHTSGFWTATIYPTNNTWMYYDLLPTDLNIPGMWALEAHAHDPALPGAVTAHLHGKPFNLDIAMPLTESSSPPTTMAPTTTITTLSPTTLAPTTLAP